VSTSSGPGSARVRRRRLLAGVTVVVAVLLAGVGLRVFGPGRSGSTARDQLGAPRASATVPITPSAKAKASPSSSAKTGAAVTVHLAFAGDVHFAGTSASALTRGLGTGAAPLRTADLAVVNLETAITNGGSAATKEFSFRAPASALQVLKSAGIDAANVANNHGMDYGAGGLQDTLAASRTYDFPLIGAGQSSTQAFAGYRTMIRGVRIAVISATDVLDSSLQTAWTAGPAKPGLASAKDGDAMAERIQAVSASSDLVIAFLHWGVEEQVCPTARQQALAAQLVQAGADVVVGSHAHVLQPLGQIAGVPVAYGMGNFVFYATRPSGIRSGVLAVTVHVVPGSGPSGHPTATTRWLPATIVGGRPMAVAPTAANALPSMAGC
jgi:poly-gamma-glutamate capsule biosynthesis protein CapA/YwtB (metallophosphatase superfamily)